MLCVARIARAPEKKLLALPGGLTITARHPVRVGGAWCLPRDLPDAAEQPTGPSGLVYNFVLHRRHVLLVDGVECATWGHHIDEPVVRHPYYGSAKRVLRDLAAMPGWSEVVVNVEGCVRDAAGEVVGLRGGGASEEGCLLGGVASL